MKHTLLLVIASFLLASCGASVAADDVKAKSDYVVLILDNAPNMSRSDTIFGRFSTGLKTLQYVDSSLYTVDYQPRGGLDTLRLPTFGGFAQLLHLYNVLEIQYYLLQMGDTVLVTYEDKTRRPQLRSLTSDSLTELYNYYMSDLGRPRILSFSATGIASAPSFMLTRQNIPIPEVDSLISEASGETSRFIEMLARAPIPQAYRDFYAQVARDDMRRLNEYKRRSDVRNGRKVSAELDWKVVLAERLRALREQMSDTLLPSLFYQNQLHLVYTVGQTRFNPEVSFERVVADTTLPPLTRRNMLRNLMWPICDGLPMAYSATFDVKKKYAQKYLDLMGDSLFLKRVLQLDIPVHGKYDIGLLTPDGRKTTLQEVVEARRGKVLYIDFWASWCGPCRSEMPASLKLKERYKGRDVEFIYISQDEDREKWLQVCEDEGIPEGNSFMAADVSRSEYYRSLEVLGIPWYVIIDRAGRTVNGNAPRPSTGDVAAEFDKNL